MQVSRILPHSSSKGMAGRAGMGRMLLVSGAVLALAGCGSTTGLTEKSVTEAVFFGGTTKLPEQKDPVREYGCPGVSILEGTVAYRVGDQSGARGVSHQASIHDLARECRTEGNTMRIKIGVQGRLVLGDGGKPGTYTIPLRVAVRGNGATISSRLVPASVTIPANDGQAPFVIIDDLVSVPITAEDPAEVYSVLVGLDPQGARQTPAKAKRQR